MNEATLMEVELTKSLLGALAAALPELGAAQKTVKNPHFKSKYADLGAVLAAIQPIAKHDLWFRQVSHDSPQGVTVETFYIHNDGELSAGKVFIPVDKNNAQGFGSAQTYARRYGLQMAFGLATEDDDGNAAQGAPPKERQQPEMPDEVYSVLAGLIQSTGTPVADILKFYKVRDLRELDKAQSDHCIDRLKTRLADQTKAKTNTMADAIGDDILEEFTR